MPPNNDPFNGILDPSTNSSGTYIYTVQGASPCPSASAEVVVVVVQAPDAGNDTTAALCSINPPVNMLNLLGGEPDAGGSWTDPDGNATSATFDPSSSIPGAYSYLMPAVASCAQAVATVDISVSPAAYAGIDGDTTVCANAESFQPTCSAAHRMLEEHGSGPAASRRWYSIRLRRSVVPIHTVTAPAPPAGYRQRGGHQTSIRCRTKLRDERGCARAGHVHQRPCRR